MCRSGVYEGSPTFSSVVVEVPEEGHCAQRRSVEHPATFGERVVLQPGDLATRIDEGALLESTVSISLAVDVNPSWTKLECSTFIP